MTVWVTFCNEYFKDDRQSDSGGRSEAEASPGKGGKAALNSCVSLHVVLTGKSSEVSRNYLDPTKPHSKNFIVLPRPL